MSLFYKKSAIMLPKRRVVFKKRSVLGVRLGGRVPNYRFWTDKSEDAA
jgi:hypothetical protein